MRKLKLRKVKYSRQVVKDRGRTLAVKIMGAGVRQIEFLISATTLN